MGSVVKKIADPVGIFGGKKNPEGLPVTAADVVDAELSSVDDKAASLEAVNRQTVQQKASAASVALADEDREVVGAGRKLGVQSSTKKKLQILG